MTMAGRSFFTRRHVAALLVWALVAGAGATFLAHARLEQLRSTFETDGRIIHRRLSQWVVQYDAVMATLALLQPPAVDAATGNTDGTAAAAVTRLPSVYPQILSVQQRTADGTWPPALAASLSAAEAASRRSGHPEMALIDLDAGRYHLVIAGSPSSYALQIDLLATIPRDEWPMDMASSPVRVTLEWGGAAFVVQPGRISDATGMWWNYGFHKRLMVPSQPLDVVAQRTVGLRELPWLAMLTWCVLTGAAWAGALAAWRQRSSRRRAEELLRLGQVARLNALGELAAGMAHELNQPLTALLSGTQAAKRLLVEDQPELEAARTAMSHVVEQARRAAAVVGRLRRLVERPDLAGNVQPLPLAAAVQDVLRLLEPELTERSIATTVTDDPSLPPVLAEPVALQQIIHNLLMNALQSLEQVPSGERRLSIAMTSADDSRVRLSIHDCGAGMAAETRQRLFEPFYTTRPGGLGLGLTLCESLAQAMDARLTLAPQASTTERGAEFILTLSIASSNHDR